MEIRDICGDYALDLELSHGEVFTMYFNSRQNALNVKRIIDVDNSVPNAATVCEMEEVRHGRWVFNGAKTYCDESVETVFFCSKCRRNVAVHTDMWTDAERYAAVIYPYCHCGAKMDGKGEYND